MNAKELLRLTSGADEPLSVLENQALEIIQKMRQLEEALLDYPQWNGLEPKLDSSHLSVIWVPEKPPHRGIERILFDTISTKASIFTANGAAHAKEMVYSGEFNMLVTGYQLGDTTGEELLRSLKKSGFWLPAVMATRNGDEALAARCMKEGFMGYFSAKMLSNPQQVREILMDTVAEAVRVRNWISSVRRVGRLAMTDGLTSLHNRYFIEQLLEMEICRSKRYKQPLCVAFLDLDGFKEVNDTLGHWSGDEVLRRVGKVLKKTVRSTDHIGRFGGDEFLLVIPQADSKSGLSLCQRILEAVEKEFQEASDGTPKIGLSIGLTCWRSEEALSLESVIHLTDKALYEAKEKGGNRICVKEGN